MKRAFFAIDIAVTSLVLAGCTQSTGIALPNPPSSTIAPATAPIPTDPAKPVALGTTVGAEHDGTTVMVTVYSVSQNAAPQSWPPQGGHWAGADVETCAPQGATSVETADWSAADEAGGATAGTAPLRPEFPQPTHPVAAPLAAGSCIRGWVIFPASYQAVLSTVTFAPGNEVAAVWQVASGQNAPGKPD